MKDQCAGTNHDELLFAKGTGSLFVERSASGFDLVRRPAEA